MLGRSKMTNTLHQCMTFLWTILWSDVQVISPTKHACMCIDASINVWGCIQSHITSQHKLCIQLKFVIKKALLLQVTSLGCHHVDVSAWVWVDSQHFGIYKSESQMMKALRNGLTMSCTMMNSQQLSLGSDYVFLKRYSATKFGHGSLCLRL